MVKKKSKKYDPFISYSHSDAPYFDVAGYLATEEGKEQLKIIEAVMKELGLN